MNRKLWASGFLAWGSGTVKQLSEIGHGILGRCLDMFANSELDRCTLSDASSTHAVKPPLPARSKAKGPSLGWRAPAKLLLWLWMGREPHSKGPGETSRAVFWRESACRAPGWVGFRFRQLASWEVCPGVGGKCPAHIAEMTKFNLCPTCIQRLPTPPVFGTTQTRMPPLLQEDPNRTKPYSKTSLTRIPGRAVFEAAS